MAPSPGDLRLVAGQQGKDLFFTTDGQEMLADQVASGLSHTLNYDSVLIPLDP